MHMGIDQAGQHIKFMHVFDLGVRRRHAQFGYRQDFLDGRARDHNRHVGFDISARAVDQRCAFIYDGLGRGLRRRLRPSGAGKTQRS